MSLSSLRGSNSRLKSYDFTAFATAIDAKLDYEKQINDGWNNVRTLSNMAEVTDAPEDIAAVDSAKKDVITLTRNWEDFTKQAERHFGITQYGIQYFSVVAHIISGVADLPDELILLKKSALRFRDGRELDSGRIVNNMQFDNISHYIRFADLCIENEVSLLTIPAYKSLSDKVTAKGAK